MKAIGFYAIFAISISNYEINSAKIDLDIADGPAFVDKDFTDYLEDPYLKRETGFSDRALTPLRDLKPNTTNNGNPKPDPEVANTLVKTTEPGFTDTAPIPLESILERVEKLNHDNKAKAFRRAKREASFSVPTSIEDIKSAFRRNGKPNTKEEKAANKHVAKLKLKHDTKVEVIMDFMKSNYMTTNYIYEEVQKMKSKDRLQNKLRALVLYLEEQHNTKLRDSILKCFYDRRKIDKPHIDIWKNRDTNNVIINVLKDLYNK